MESGNMWLVNPGLIVAAIAMDVVIGDPQGWPHITRCAGVLAVTYERWLTHCFSRSILLGVIFWFLVVGTMVAGYVVTRTVCFLISPMASHVFDLLIIYQAIAARDLYQHAKSILQALVSGDLDVARRRLAYIVGRDTKRLDTSEISRATIESVAESLVDGILGPLFWAVVGGAAGALIYRTANTLDSMVGHRTAAYERFGKASARIDDLLNWVPARICVLIICWFRVRDSWSEIKREASAHASPNAGWPEAAMAYTLGVRLGGTNSYDGGPVQGPVFNVSGRAAGIGDIKTSLSCIWWVVFAAGGVCLALSFCGNLSRRDERTQPGVLTPGIDQKMARPERAEDICCPRFVWSTSSLLRYRLYRPSRAGAYFNRYLGLKPQAESSSPFGTNESPIFTQTIS